MKFGDLVNYFILLISFFILDAIFENFVFFFIFILHLLIYFNENRDK